MALHSGYNLANAERSRLSARRGILLLFLYITFFGLPQLLWGTDAGGWFWLTLAVSFIFGLSCFKGGSITLQFYYIFFVFVMMFSYFVQTVTGISYIPSMIQPTMFDSKAFIVLTAHFLGLTVGANLWKDGGPKPRYKHRLPRFYWIAGVAIIAVSTIMFIAVFGTGPLFSARNEIVSDERSGTASVLAKIVKVLPFMFLAFLSSRLEGGKVRPRDIIPMIICLAFAVVFTNPVTTARYISLTGILLVLAAWLGRTSKSDHLLSFVVLGAYSAMILLPITSLLREGIDNIKYTTLARMYSGLEFSAVQMILDGIDFSSRVSGAGRQVISDFLSLMPPVLYDGRTPSLGPKIAEMSGYVFDNAAISSFMSAYVDAGIIGVVVFSVFMGFIMRQAIVHRGMDMRNRRDGYALILFACIPILARGSFSTAMAAIYEFVVAYEIFRFATRFRFGRAGGGVDFPGYQAGTDPYRAYGVRRMNTR